MTAMVRRLVSDARTLAATLTYDRSSGPLVGATTDFSGDACARPQSPRVHRPYNCGQIVFGLADTVLFAPGFAGEGAYRGGLDWSSGVNLTNILANATGQGRGAIDVVFWDGRIRGGRWRCVGDWR